MSGPRIHGKLRTLSASSILEAVASDLMQIKNEDKLTYSDLGRVLGKSDDQAAKYCDGTAEMGITAFAFARREWNGRFTGTLDALIDPLQACDKSDRGRATAIAKAQFALSCALEDDGEATPHEVRKMRKDLEEAREAIDALLKKLSVRVA